MLVVVVFCFVFLCTETMLAGLIRLANTYFLQFSHLMMPIKMYCTSFFICCLH